MCSVLSTLPRHQGTRAPGSSRIRPLSPTSRPLNPAGMRQNAAVLPQSPFTAAPSIRTWGRSSLLGHPRKPISGLRGGFLLRGPDAASFSVSPSPRRLCGYSPRSLDPLLTGLLIRSCSLSAACLPSCVALGLALLRPTDYHGATFAPFPWPRGLSVLLLRGPAGLGYALSRAGRGRAFILLTLHALWPCRSALGRPPGPGPSPSPCPCLSLTSWL